MMKEKAATAMRDALADMLGILEYKVRNDAMSSEDVRAILTTLEAGGGVRATVSDIAGYYHRSEADVRNVIHRNLMLSEQEGSTPDVAKAAADTKKYIENQYGWETRPFDELYIKTVALGIPIYWDEML